MSYTSSCEGVLLCQAVIFSWNISARELSRYTSLPYCLSTVSKPRRGSDNYPHFERLLTVVLRSFRSRKWMTLDDQKRVLPGGSFWVSGTLLLPMWQEDAGQLAASHSHC